MDAPASANEGGSKRALRSGLWRVISWVLTIQLVVSCLLALVFVTFTVAQHVLGYESYSVLSGSMQPAIPVGALVITQPEPADSVRVGQVITFPPPSDNGILVTHRVHSIDNVSGLRVFITKGDANATADNWRIPGVGRFQLVVAQIPIAGYISSDLQTGTAHVAFLFAPGVLLCLLLLVEIWRPRQRPDGIPSRGATAIRPAVNGNHRVRYRGPAPEQAARLAPPVALVLTGLLFLLQPLLESSIPIQVVVGSIALAAGLFLTVLTWRHRDYEPLPRMPLIRVVKVRPKEVPELSDEQRAILALVAQGLDSRDIAARLETSLAVVRHELDGALTRLDAVSELDAALKAARYGLLQ